MSVPSIRVFPDPFLKHPTRWVERFTPDVLRVIDTLIATMRRHPRCVGLAAPQIGSDLRLAVMDASGHPNAQASRGLLVLVNPVMDGMEGARIGREGCLSIPDLTANVRRAERVRVRAQDRAGVDFAVWLDGFEAVIAQHEIDHLDGTLFLDRVANPTTDLFRRTSYG